MIDGLVSQSSIRPGDDSDSPSAPGRITRGGYVAIQYSPWR